MSLRSRPNKTAKPMASAKEIAQGAMSLYTDQTRVIIEDGNLAVAEGVDTNLTKLGSPEQGVLVGSVKIRGTRMTVSPDQIMLNGKTYDTGSGQEIPYGQGVKDRMTSISR